MIINSITHILEEPPTGHSDRVMSHRIPITGNKYATIISVYAPNLYAESAEIETFYTTLRDLLAKTSKNDKLVIMGGFNARVGTRD